MIEIARYLQIGTEITAILVPSHTYVTDKLPSSPAPWVQMGAQNKRDVQGRNFYAIFSLQNSQVLCSNFRYFGLSMWFRERAQHPIQLIK